MCSCAQAGPGPHEIPMLPRRAEETVPGRGPQGNDGSSSDSYVIKMFPCVGRSGSLLRARAVMVDISAPILYYLRASPIEATSETEAEIEKGHFEMR